MFPPVPAAVIEAGLRRTSPTRWNPIMDVFEECGVRFALEVHPSEIAYDFWTDGGDVGRDRPRASRSASTGTRATWCGRTSIRSGSCGTSATGSTTSTARTPGVASAMAATVASGRTCRGVIRGRGWDFVSTGHGDVPWEQCFRMLNTIGYDGPISIEWEDAGMDRLHGAAEAVGFVRSCLFDPPTASFDAAFAQK